MNRSLVRRLTPEEEELVRKRGELGALEVSLVQRELDLATLRAELFLLNQQYLRAVGVKYAELDGLAAQIAEELARLNPQDAQAQERAHQARTQARDSASEANEARVDTKPLVTPSERLRKLYRTLAKRIHPDLATDERERSRRTALMAEVNRAYEAGDEARLEALLSDAENEHDTIGGGIGAELVRIIRKIAQVRERLRQIEAEIVAVGRSDIAVLRDKMQAAAREGRDLLTEMAAPVDAQIAEARAHLAALTERGRRDE